MALEGNLTDFSLNDMFRLLQSGSKSGTLHVGSRSGSGRVCFRDGRIFYASLGEGEGEPMAARLARAGIVSDKQLRQAQGLMKIQRKDKAGRKLSQILVDEGYVPAQIVDRFVREQISDALFELLRWDEGSLRFEPDEDCAQFDIGVAVPVAEALEAADKRLDTWRTILEKIESLDTAFVMSATPGAQSIDLRLKPREWMLLCHMHGGKSARELAQLTGYSDFETASIIYDMYTGGLIEQGATQAG